MFSFEIWWNETSKCKFFVCTNIPLRWFLCQYVYLLVFEVCGNFNIWSLIVKCCHYSIASIGIEQKYGNCKQTADEIFSIFLRMEFLCNVFKVWMYIYQFFLKAAKYFWCQKIEFITFFIFLVFSCPVTLGFLCFNSNYLKHS